MTPAERAVKRALDKAVRDSARNSARIKDARVALALDKCSHPQECRIPYQWEHDNGYGRLSMVDGMRCRLCEATSYWGDF